MNKLQSFKKMHDSNDLLLLPNAWDLLSALVLAQSGFKAIATSSWGVANALGYNDGEKIEFNQLYTLVSKMTSLINIPVSVDIESGYSDDIEVITDNVLKLADIGVVGINIEDSSKDNTSLVSTTKHCQIVEKIRSELDNNGFSDFFINARTDTYFLLENPLIETINRSKAYIESGANGIFVPGLSSDEDIASLIGAVNTPINVMSLPHLTDIKHLEKLGVKRFSTGPALSDAVISFIERESRILLSQQSTTSLYKGRNIQTIFK
jgi:2-methylisocitrate lyase-like PEP mutase family enzyme